MKNTTGCLLLIIALSLGACISRSKVSSAEFGRYIAGFTSGTVQPDDEIRIELSQALLDSARIDRKDTAALEKSFDISPSVKGTLYWKNEKTIAFVPATKFKEGKQYHVALNLGRFADVPRDFRHFHFLFETEPQTFKVEENGLSFYEAYNTDWQKYELTVTSNVALDTQQVRNCFRAFQDHKPIRITCTATDSRHYRITADSIQRKENASTLEIHWNAAKAGCDDKGSKTVNITSLGSYTVLNMEVTDDGDQKLKITFSEPILSQQHFDGMIEVQDAKKMQFEASGNTVTIFFPDRLDGDKKVTVNKGILNFGNHKMDSTTSGTVSFQGPEPALRMEGKGCILPNSQGLLFPFESIGIHSVDVRIIKIREQNMHQFLQVNELDGYDELTRVGKIAIEKTIRIIADTTTPQNQWTTHILDLSKLIQPEPGSLYRVCIRFRKAYTYLPCRNETEDEGRRYVYEVAAGQDSAWNEYGWHGEGFDGYNTWRYDGYAPCEDGYYRGGAISKNILASDIGVIYQEEKNQTARIVTTNLLDARALAHTEVALYAYTREKIASGITDDQGFLQVSLSQKPFLLVARKDKQRAYLKLTNSNCLSTASFNVEGTDQGNGLKGFLYAERGVWRPGDSVFLHFVLNDQSNPLPAQHPIQFELSDPDGKSVFKRTVTENSGHIYPLYFQTSPNAPMGTYTASVKVGNAVFSKSILLEYIVPNRMKLSGNVDGKLLTLNDSTTEVKVMWLNGLAGKGLKTQASVSLRPDFNYFKKYGAYTFIAPYNERFQGAFELEETLTDAAGLAIFRNAYNATANVPGMLKATYVFKAYEQGAGFSIDKATSTVSLLDGYVGIKKPEGAGYSGSLDYSRSYAFGYVVAGKDQQRIDGHHLQLKIYEMQYQRWYEADDADITSFRSQQSRICVKDTQWVAAKGEGAFRFGNIGKHYGRYLIVLKDLATGHETGCVAIFDDPYWDRYGNDDADFESIVPLSVNKKSYLAGEKIQLQVPAGANANILVNIESDAKVLQQFWVKGNAEHKPVEFTATAAMAPGIYIHVTVLQPHHYTKDGSPIRQYGILPVKIEDPETKLRPLISMKNEIRPETNATIGISEAGGKEMYYSLVLVDEGLLDLTHFKTPDIWQQMNAQQSLKIKTWDLFNQVIGAYSGKIANVFTIGGDGSYDESATTKANRFRPAIINLGVFHLNPGQRRQHTFAVPNYSGSMKAFVVAYHKEKSGSAEKAFYVRKPLMLLTGAPRMMSAGETYTLPVTVFNMEKKARSAQVTLSITGLSGYRYNTARRIQFKGEGDEVVEFGISVPAEAGILHMELAAADGAERAGETIEIQVKPTRPAVNHQKLIAVAPGATVVTDAAVKGVKGTYSSSVTLTDMANFDLQNSLNYLIEYPHGCVEQTTSSAFAQLLLNEVQDISDQEAPAVKKHVESVIRRLNQYQTYSGGFAYWPYQYEVNEYASVYVLHFMMEAQRRGFEVPKYVWDNAINYQKNQAGKYDNQNPYSSYIYKDLELTQAYRLFLLAELNLADVSAMNKLKAGSIQSDLAKALLAKAYRIIGKTGTAAELTPGNILKADPADGTGFGSALRDRSMMLIALQHTGNTAACQQLAGEICAGLSNGWNSTLATSMALVSLSGYYGLAAPVPKPYTINGKPGTLSKHSQTIKRNPKDPNGQLSFRNNSAKPMYLVLNEYYADINPVTTLVNNGMQLKISYLDMNNKTIREADLRHGANFIAKIAVTNLTKTTLQHVALDYYIANGWQFISNRYIDDESRNKNSDCTFRNAQDDRINMFFDLEARETKTFFVQLNASYKGRFFLPMAQCYPMYNERYKAQVAGKWVTVN